MKLVQRYQPFPEANFGHIESEILFLWELIHLRERGLRIYQSHYRYFPDVYPNPITGITVVLAPPPPPPPPPLTSPLAPVFRRRIPDLLCYLKVSLCISGTAFPPSFLAQERTL